MSNGNFTSTVVSIRYPYWVDTLIDQLGGLLQQRSSQHNDTGCSVSYFIILRLRKLDEQLGNVVGDFHLHF